MEQQVYSGSSQDDKSEDQAELMVFDIQNRSNQSLSKVVKQFWDKFSNGSKVRIPQKFPFKQVVGDKSVCAKIIKRGQTIVQCYDCRADHSCIICLDCFKNGNHQGHKYVIKTAYGGCCDCGDAQAWAKQGFCSKHSGQMMDVNIPPEEIKAFVEVFVQLFYLYFKYRSSRKDLCIKYYIELCGYLQSLNKDSLYYNKITTQLFSTRISKQKLLLFGNRNEICILGNILEFFSQQISNITMQLFLSMFPYYPFKQLLLSNYFTYFHLIYDGTDSAMSTGTSIACQLLTSYQLVGDLVQSKGQLGLGELIVKKKSQKKTNSVVYLLIHDFHYFSKLQGDTPKIFWQFQVRRGIDKIFLSYEQFKSEAAKTLVEGSSSHLKATVYGDLSQIQFKIIELCLQIIECLKGDRQTLIILLKFLFDRVRQQEQTKTITIFRPYQRALSVALFAYFDMNLDNCCNNFKSQLLEILELSQQKFQIQLMVLTKKMLKTYFFYTKIITEAGLSSTYATYFYFYKYKGRMMMSTDVVLIKMCLLMLKSEPVITPQKLIGLESLDPDCLQKIHFQKYLLIFKDLTHLYVSKNAEIYLTMAMNKSSEVYQQTIRKMMAAVCYEIKDNINKQAIKFMEEDFFHPNARIIDRYLKVMCTFTKEKKKFELKQQFYPQQGVNFNDYRSNFKSEQPFQNIKKSSQFVSQIEKKIVVKIWSEQTILKNIKIFHHFLSVFNGQQNQSIKALIYEFHKVYQILKMVNCKQAFHIYEKILSVTQIRKYLPDILQPGSDKSLKNGTMIDCEDQRKRKIKQIQAMKMQKLRDKQKKVIISMQLAQSSLSPSELQPQNESQLICGICRSQNNQDMVYLCNASIRNYEKTCGLTEGEGVQCLSFKSCYHAFHSKCITEHVKGSWAAGFMCPMCRQISNSFIPCSKNQQLAYFSMAYISQVMSSYKDIQQQSMQEEIIKSFYHFFLLCLIDLEHTLKKKLVIYKHALSIVKFTTEKKQLMQLLQKVINHKFVLFHSDKKVKKHKYNNLTLLFTQLQQNMGLLNQMDQNGLVQILNAQNDAEIQLMDVQQAPLAGGNKTKSKKKIFNSQKSNQKRAAELNQQHQNQSQIFQNIVYRILCRILQIQQQKKSAKIQNLPAEYEQVAKIALDALFEQETSVISCLARVHTKEGYKYSKIARFRQLPSRYTPLGNIKSCSVCQQISASLALCLYCQNFAICLKCKNKKGGLNQHAKQKHGNTCPFLHLSTTMIKVCVNGQLYDCGQAYKDEYTGGFKLAKNWDDYQLDQMLIMEVMQNIQWDQVDTKGRKVK